MIGQCALAKLLSPDVSLRREVESLRQSLFNSWPIAFYRPVSICKDFSYLDSNSRPVTGIDELLQQRFTYVLTAFRNGIDCRDANIVIVIR